MAEKGVPYFSPAQRAIGVAAGVGAAIVGALAANLTGIEDLVLFAIMCITPVLLALAVWRLWFEQSSPRITRSERQTRYAIDTLHAPYWQALLMHGAPGATPALVMLALERRSADGIALLLIIILPVVYLLAAATLHFERQRARRLLGEAAT